MTTPRIVGYGVIVFDYPIADVASYRAYTFPTLEEAVDATKAARERGVEAHYAPIRRGDILAEERGAAMKCPVCQDDLNAGGFCINLSCARAGEQAAEALFRSASADDVPPCPACGSVELDCEEDCPVRIEQRERDKEEVV